MNSIYRTLLATILPSFIVVVFLCLIKTIAVSAVALAQAGATFTINNSSDMADANPGDGICTTAEGYCTLRAAVMEANALPDADTIILPSGVYTLTLSGTNEDAAATGDLDITSDLTLIGTGADSTIVDGGALDRVFHVVTNTVTASISGVTMRNGMDGTYSLNDPQPGQGGGLFNAGTLILADSVVSDNHAYYFGGTVGSKGGGIFNSGVLTVRSSVIVSNIAHRLSGFNTSPYGSGIFNQGVLTITDSFIISNTAVGYDGGSLHNWHKIVMFNSVVGSNTGRGIVNWGKITVTASVISNNTSGGILSGGPLTVTASSIISNTADNGGGIELPCCSRRSLTLINSTLSGNTAADNGGGIYFLSGHPSGTINLNNVTIVNNIANSDGDPFGEGGGIYNYASIGIINIKNSIVATNSGGDISGETNSLGYNLIGVDAGLGPLLDNGGATPTHALLPNSPAIDAGDPDGCTSHPGSLWLDTDQRGFPRPVDGDGDGTAVCDIGAYELWVPSHRVYLPVIMQ